jgi:thymidylate kinase
MKNNRTAFILEGVNGAGKTTLARSLSRALRTRMEGCELAPIARPFHNINPDSHWGQTGDYEEKNLRAVGVPIQTPADDFYVADMIMKLLPRVVICDRSLLTGFAYGDFDRGTRSVMREWAMSYWASMLMKNHNVVLIHLTASYDACKERCGSEGREKHRSVQSWEDLAERYRKAVDQAKPYMTETVELDTGAMDLTATVDSVLNLGY